MRLIKSNLCLLPANHKNEILNNFTFSFFCNLFSHLTLKQEFYFENSLNLSNKSIYNLCSYDVENSIKLLANSSPIPRSSNIFNNKSYKLPSNTLQSTL